jgi:hypothetical protein
MLDSQDTGEFVFHIYNTGNEDNDLSSRALCRKMGIYP